MRDEIWELDKDKRVDMLTANAQAFHDAMDKDPSVADDFLKHFADLLRILADQQEAGVKGPLRFITMSFLKSSVITETYEIALTCHSNDVFLDEAETEIYWRMGFFRDMVDSDMERIVPRLKQKIFRIRDYEIEEFRAFYALTYTALVLTFFSRVLSRVFDLPEFLAVQKETFVDISFGGYMEETVTLAQYSKEDE